ncbi:response regulator [Kitasatospora sp. NPDC093550]|uniref:response regulator n=1 Tax=Kitasatospora sp. NPDC093550 TaxID=3364089 RepID=UPI003820814C
MTLTLIVDDQPLLRAGLQMIIESAEDLKARVAGGAEAVAEARRCRPDVVLLDMQVSDADGFGILKALLDLPGSPRVAVLAPPVMDEGVLTALRMGAAGFLLRDTGPDQLLASVRALAVGSTVLSTMAASRLLSEVADDVRHADATLAARRLTSLLSVREQEVLAMVAEGLSNADIGRRLVIGTGTVKDCVSDILAKLGVANRVQAAVIAHRAWQAGCAPLPTRAA